MKTVAFRNKFFSAAAALLLAAIIECPAAPPHAQHLCGVVQQLDSKKRTLILQVEGRTAPLTFAWNTNTEFLKDRQPATAAQLATDQHVCVDYQKPFFGKPLITKVAWASGQAP